MALCLKVDGYKKTKENKLERKEESGNHPQNDEMWVSNQKKRIALDLYRDKYCSECVIILISHSCTDN